MNESTARISALHLYPVKGCRGIATATAIAAATGLALNGVSDREWMVVDQTGQFVTQRDIPRMALVDVTISAGRLHLGAIGIPPLVVALDRAPVASRGVIVWRSEVAGYDEGDDAAAWLKKVLDADVRLVRFDRAVPRPCNPEFAGDTGAHTLFADGYPLLVIGQASLIDLNERLAARGARSVPMNRFRPNVVIDGLPAFAEDHIDTIELDGVVLKCVKPCVRCQVTTTDQATAQIGSEPLSMLAEFRMDARFGGVTFGMNAVVIVGAGRALTRESRAMVDYRF
jgi:uncharacterized protein YcbX